MRSTHVIGSIVGFLFGAAAIAQPCPQDWRSFDPRTAEYSGVNSAVYASTLWDPDGTGPLTPRVVVGGLFSIAGTTQARGIAAFDPDTRQWAALGNGLDSSVRVVLALPNGDLVAGGGWAGNVARWDGTAWRAMGNGLSISPVRALALAPNGDVIAGGDFIHAGNPAVPVRGVARWDGSTWRGFGDGISSSSPGTVNAVAVLPNGDVIAGGGFTTTRNGTLARRLARWEGSAWSEFGGGAGNTVNALLVLPSGDLIAAGTFNSIGGVAASLVARWDGSTWNAVGPGSLISGSVLSLTQTPDGGLLAAGRFGGTTPGGTHGVARWDGSVWTMLQTSPATPPAPFVLTVTATAELPTGRAYAGGAFTSLDGDGPSYFAVRDATGWEEVNGENIFGLGQVNAIVHRDAERFVVGGNLGPFGGPTTGYVAEWNGTGWIPIAQQAGTRVNDIAFDPAGGLFAAGNFSSIDGVQATSIARWDGTTWNNLSGGLEFAGPGEIRAIKVLSNGDLAVGGSFLYAGGSSLNNLARWNGVTWSSIGGGVDRDVNDIIELGNGDIVVCGTFQNAGGVPADRIARWNGSAWSAFGTGLSNTAHVLLNASDGSILVGGRFLNAGNVPASRIARWDGTAWRALGSGLSGSSTSAVWALDETAPGQIAASGSFSRAGALEVNNIALWNGTQWRAMGGGLLSPLGSNGVRAIGRFAGGEILAAGNATPDDNSIAIGIARFACAPGACDGVDFNRDGVFPSTDDISDYLSVLAGGPCSNDPNCGDSDIDNDGTSPSTGDLETLLRLFAGGHC